MARPAGFSSIGAMLVLTSVLVVMGFDRGDAAAGRGRTRAVVAASDKDTGLAGDPEDPNVNTKAYAEGLGWAHQYLIIFRRSEDGDVTCKKNAAGKEVRLRIEPEKRVHRLDTSDFKVRGRFVARITNIDDNLSCDDWELPHGNVAYLWMGYTPGGGEVRVYREVSPGRFKKVAYGSLDKCSDGDHGKPLAKWKKSCGPGFVHGSTWVSCSGGCCYAKSLGLVSP